MKTTNVTAAHIQGATPRSGRDCPVSRCLSELYPGKIVRVWTKGGKAGAWVFSGSEMINISENTPPEKYFEILAAGAEPRLEFPAHVYNKIRVYDTTEVMEPFDFKFEEN